jgi:hypothetical protein
MLNTKRGLGIVFDAILSFYGAGHRICPSWFLAFRLRFGDPDDERPRSPVELPRIVTNKLAVLDLIGGQSGIYYTSHEQ